MLMIRNDLQTLAGHAGIVIDDDEEVGIIWRCFECKSTIDYVAVEIRVDYGVQVVRVEIDRPYCPECDPWAKLRPEIYLPSIYQPITQEDLVSVSRYPSLKLVIHNPK